MRLHCDIITFMTLAQLISRMQALKGRGDFGDPEEWGFGKSLQIRGNHKRFSAHQMCNL